MADRSKFIIVDHKAKRAGQHQDLRFKQPSSSWWDSFAVPKGVPTKVGLRVLAVKTNKHSEKDALFIGKIDEGYGKGQLSKFDDGICEIEKYTSAHIVLVFKGAKIKGRYHLVSTKVVGKDKKYKEFMLFKGKE